MSWKLWKVLKSLEKPWKCLEKHWKNGSVDSRARTDLLFSLVFFLSASIYTKAVLQIGKLLPSCFNFCHFCMEFNGYQFILAVWMTFKEAFVGLIGSFLDGLSDGLLSSIIKGMIGRFMKLNLVLKWLAG